MTLASIPPSILYHSSSMVPSSPVHPTVAPASPPLPQPAPVQDSSSAGAGAVHGSPAGPCGALGGPGGSSVLGGHTHPSCRCRRFQPALGGDAAVPGAGARAGPGAFCGGGLRQHLLQRLRGAVHAAPAQHAPRWVQVPPPCPAGMGTAPCHPLSFRLSPGYRHIHLLSKDGASLSPATLFVHVRCKSL